MKPSNQSLYDKIKLIINKRYKKNSAYRSMAYIKEYKRQNGTFIKDGKTKKLLRWKNEKWQDVNPNRTKKSYPVFRPTRRISIKTPLLDSEISKQELIKQSKIKQKIKGIRNLRPFIPN